MPTLNKLEYLDETKQQIKNALNTNFNSQIQNTDTFRSYVTKIKNIYSNWPKVTDEDNQINLTPTRKGKMNLTLKSTELIQDTTPTPDNPVDVNVITGDNNIKVVNENLLSLPTDATVLGITSTQNSDGSFTLNGTVTSTPNYKEFPLDTPVTLEAGTYYFTIINNKLNSNNNMNINLYTGNTLVIDKNYATIGEHKEIITLTETKTIKSFRTWITTGTSCDNVNIKLMISKTSDSTFVEHQEQNYPITLDDLEYCKIGEYADQIFKNTTNSPYYDNTLIENEWYLKKNIGKVTFDGSADEVYEKVYGSIYNNKCIFYLRNIPHNNSNYQLMKSNRFIATKGASEYYPEGINTSYNSDFLGLVLSADRLTDYSSEALRVFFQNNHTDVYLVAATPTHIHISQTDYPILRSQLENLYNNAKSYDGQTNITQTNDNLPFIINASALMRGGN